MINDSLLVQSINQLEEYIKHQDFAGFDPYDALNSPQLHKLRSKMLKILATQFFVYSPINLRNFFQIPREKNPKAIGLILSAYCNLYKKKYISKSYFHQVSTYLSDYLIKHRSKEYSNYCWGFNFPWQDIKRYSPKYLPTIVVTSYVAQAFLDLFEITKKKTYLEIAESSATFILHDLNVTKRKNGICFSYTPIDEFIVHNANALGAALLTRLYNIIKKREYLHYATQVINFTCNYQLKNGAWNYSINRETDKERGQIDFHQGFILEAITDYIKWSEDKSENNINCLKKGATFYQKQQFDSNGLSKWRLPHRYPIDIHHQAQGIITFTKINQILKQKQYLKQAEIITQKTIHQFQDKKGYFYYQKFPFFTNKIPYMRWSQAWMFLALSLLLEKK